MNVNNILLTAGQDDESGSISIPNVAEPTAATPEVPPVPKVEPPVDSGFGKATSPHYNEGQARMYVPQGRAGKQARKAMRKQRDKKGCLIEFYDPELERLDVDDYERSVLLVSDNDEVTTARTAASKLLARKLTDIKPTLNYAWGDYDAEKLPDDFHERMDHGEYVQVTPARSVLQWEPTNLWYYPLYFQDVGLERYGHTRKPWIQPFVSTGRFFGQVAALPYQMTLHPPKNKEFALGYYQPGEWAPKKKYRVPFNEEATAVQFLWVTGLVLLIP